MEPNTIDALTWIVGILNKHKILYRVGGGFAAHVYGSNRPVTDIDITLSGTYFSVLLPEVSEYITEGPAHYTNEKWDCDSLSLNYHGQDIDITDIDTLRMSNKEKTEWLRMNDHFRKFDTIPTEVAGIMVSLIDPRDLVAYKAHLDGEHQLADIEAVNRYVERPMD